MGGDEGYRLIVMFRAELLRYKDAKMDAFVGSEDTNLGGV
jgi:hypothetical protein